MESVPCDPLPRDGVRGWLCARIAPQTPLSCILQTVQCISPPCSAHCACIIHLSPAIPQPHMCLTPACTGQTHPHTNRRGSLLTNHRVCVAVSQYVPRSHAIGINTLRNTSLAATRLYAYQKRKAKNAFGTEAHNGKMDMEKWRRTTAP